MSQSQIILLVLAVVGVVFGFGVIFIGRRSKPTPAPRTTIAETRAATPVVDKPIETPVITEPVVAAPVI